MPKNLVHTLIMGADTNPPLCFTNPFSYVPHPLCLEASAEVRRYVIHTDEWAEELRMGKMFGVLVVSGSEISEEQNHKKRGGKSCDYDESRLNDEFKHHEIEVFLQDDFKNRKNNLGYLAAFSGQLNGESVVDGFVPPIFDVNTSDYFIRKMHEIESILDNPQERKRRSEALQDWLFRQYKCMNIRGREKSIMDIFTEYYRKKMLKQANYSRNASSHHIPSGSGDCCAPKLLDYAFRHGLRPICMAEFWIQAPYDKEKNGSYKYFSASEVRHDGMFYPSCNNKCRPILDFMLEGITTEKSLMEEENAKLLDDVKIVYEDQEIIVVDKPSGLLSVPGRDSRLKSVADWLIDYHKTEHFLLVHRLDQDTSGLLIIAKNESTYKDLQQQFIHHEVKKTYEALLDGTVEGNDGKIKLRMRPDPYDSPRQIVDEEHGKQAVTRWKVLKRFDGKTLVELYPDTGRTHQLRVHCAHPQGLNSPIHGDRLYGKETSDSKLCLRAKRIEFFHNGKLMILDVS